MKFDDNLNYCILSNNITKAFLKSIANLPIIDSNEDFASLKAKLEFFPSKRLIFNETWYSLSNNEIKEIIELLNKQNIKYLNVTSNIEEAIYSDHIMVYDDNNLVIEGSKENVLKEEKTLKRLGYGLPFVVDLSIQLEFYEILNKTYYDLESLLGALWN